MLRWLIRSLIFLCILTVGGLCALLYALPMVVPQESLRSGISKIFADATGKELEIRGKIEASLLPTAYLRISDAIVREAARPDAAQRRVEGFELTLDLWQALANRVAGKLTSRLDGREIEARISLPSLYRYNSGGFNPVDVSVRAPFVFNLRGMLQGTKNSIRLENAEFSLVTTAGKGTLEAGTSELRDTIEGKWKFSTLDMDEAARTRASALEIAAIFLPPKEGAAQEAAPDSKEKKTAENEAPFAWPETPLYLRWIALLKADVSLEAEELILQGAKYGNVMLKLEADKGKLMLGIDRAQLFGGEAVASLLVDVTEGKPAAQHKLTLRSVDVEALLRSACDCDTVGGTGDITLQAETQGDSVREMMTNLKGTGSFRIREGAIKGVDVLGMANADPVAVNKAFYQGKRDTKVTTSRATFTIENGVLSNDDFEMEVPFSRLNGKGTLDLAKLLINYRVTPVLGLEQLGLRVPLMLNGGLLRPAVEPDIAGFVTQGLDSLLVDGTGAKSLSDEERKKLRQELKQVRQELMKKLPPEVRAKLRAQHPDLQEQPTSQGSVLPEKPAEGAPALAPASEAPASAETPEAPAPLPAAESVPTPAPEAAPARETTPVQEPSSAEVPVPAEPQQGQ